MEGPYVRELDREGRGLSFENARLEAEYQAHAAGRHAGDLRNQLLIGGLMIAVLCLFDFLLLDTAFAAEAALLRLGIMLPPLLLMAALTKRRGGRRYLQAAGVLVALAERFGLPVHAVGVGETAEDLRPFSARAFARALVGLDPDG